MTTPQEVRGARHDALVNEDGWDAAEFVTYDNDTSHLVADDVQEAIDELAGRVSDPDGPPLPVNLALGAIIDVGAEVYDGYVEILADSPDWYLRFEEPTGPFGDTSPNAVTVTETGAVTRGVTGPVGSDDAITVDAADKLTLGYAAVSKTAESIECWIKTTTTGAVVIEQGRGSVGCCLQLAIGNTAFGATAGQVGAFFNSTSFWQGIHTTATYNDGNWHHVAATWSGTVVAANIKLYIDGVLATTTADSGNTGSRSSPISGDGAMTLFDPAGDISVAEMAFFSTELSAGRVAAHADTGGAEAWIGGGLGVTDGDDATYETAEGSNAVRLDLGAPFEIVRVRLRIATETAGARSYLLEAATLADYSDAVTATTLAFTAVGSFTAQDVEDSWTPTGAYRYWQLTGDDETRRVHELELYEGDPLLLQIQEELDAHLADTVDAHDASAISFTPTGTIAATDVQAAIAEAATDAAAALAAHAALPATGGTDHVHIDNIAYSGDGSTTAFELPAAPFDEFSVKAFIAGVRSAITLSGYLLTTMTFGSAPASGTDNVTVDIVAAVV
jgi:hypothetical protein